jgi:probable rRNA maturation factor
MIVDVRNRQRRRVNTRQLRQLAERVHTGQSLSIVFVSDREMAKLNLRYHHVASSTDILTFDYGDGQGELIISVDHAVANARQYRTILARELALYVVHGILHLRGYDDRTPAQRRRMRAAERRLLAKL